MPIFHGINKPCRITSYNVCYTKLLRIEFLSKAEYWIFDEEVGYLFKIHISTSSFVHPWEVKSLYTACLFHGILALGFWCSWNSPNRWPISCFTAQWNSLEFDLKPFDPTHIVNFLKSDLRYASPNRITSYNVCYTKLLRLNHLLN